MPTQSSCGTLVEATSCQRDRSPLVDPTEGSRYRLAMVCGTDTPSREWLHPGGQYVVSTDPARLDLDVIHGFLRESYWSTGITREVVQRAILGSLAFGMYATNGGQVGFARVITDRATVAHLADVFVVPSERGRGLSKWLMSVIVEHPDLQGLRRWLLGTRDAHGLYAQFGFTPLKAPERLMERHDPDVYTRPPVPHGGS